MIIFKLVIKSQLLYFSYELPVRVTFQAQSPSYIMGSQPMSRVFRLLKLHGDHVRLYMPFHKPTDWFRLNFVSAVTSASYLANFTS